MNENIITAQLNQFVTYPIDEPHFILISTVFKAIFPISYLILSVPSFRGGTKVPVFAIFELN
jgi:hypothetical protein